jgi:hypothetical protein
MNIRMPGYKTVAIIALQTIFCGKPYIAFPVLAYLADLIAGQSVVGGEVAEYECLFLCSCLGMNCAQAEKGQEPGARYERKELFQIQDLLR